MNKDAIDLENKEYSNLAFRLKGSDPLLRKNHSHEGFEIIQTWSDNGYVLIKDKVYPMQIGAIYIINGIESHSTNPFEDKEYIRSKITFLPSYFRSIIELMNQGFLFEPFNSKDVNSHCMFIPSPGIEKEFDDLFYKIEIESLKEESGATAYISACIVKMLTLIYRMFLNEPKTILQQNSSHHNHIQNIMTIINQDLFRDLALEEICEKVFLNKYYMCHLFKKVTGMTILQYVVERRISEAKKLLISTDMTISDISASTGFSSFSLFSRTFKRLTNVNPFTYRKMSVIEDSKLG